MVHCVVCRICLRTFSGLQLVYCRSNVTCLLRRQFFGRTHFTVAFHGEK